MEVSNRQAKRIASMLTPKLLEEAEESLSKLNAKVARNPSVENERADRAYIAGFLQSRMEQKLREGTF